ncbi:MAG: hypothetical protein ACRDT0_22535 [Pseudonocardiaceae bacterium]
MVQAVRVRAGHIETVLIHGEHEALGARCRDEEPPEVVWQQAGGTAEVIAGLLDLPAPSAQAPRCWPARHRSGCGCRRADAPRLARESAGLCSDSSVICLCHMVHDSPELPIAEAVIHVNNRPKVSIQCRLAHTL